MKILLLGGPKFLGRALIESALARGHELTTFNRGTTHPELFPELEKLHGDRTTHLDALRGRTWDVVLDTCGYVPRHVRTSAEFLADAAEHYTFISSLSVYAGTATPGLDESAPVGKLDDETVEEVTGETYGPLKALCEQAVEQAFPGRALHVRAGLIVGPHDISDRFTYWPVRVARGGEILAPGHPGWLTQQVDVRDLADWVVRMAEVRKAGVYNATGPAQPLTFGEVLDVCVEASAQKPKFTWVSEAFLAEEKVGAWIELPLWIPETEPDFAGFSAINCAKAIADGLTFRPLHETVQDTLAWATTRPADYVWRAGLKPEREAELLDKWHNR
ncbi:MAG: SDR family oxidoreductase [Anaerolineales bacterium]|nr:SDR family oxidoreductase [Anaerolineales bacterium]